MTDSYCLIFEFFQVPSKPSGYIGTVLKPLTAIDLTAGRGQEWGKRIIEHVTEKYVNV